MLCMASDLENDKLFLTKRPSLCRNVLFHLSTCAVQPVSLPAAVCWSEGMTNWYAFQKSL